ncbi:MAG: phosphoenolpyruvate mutase [bacterium]
MRKNSSKLRRLFERNGIIKIVGAHDGLTAKLVEASGFDGVWASGLEVSTSHAVPDANILTMTQYLERAAEMNGAVSIPVVADCDTGYGNANNVIHMVKAYESAGIAAVCIEDKRFPKVNSYVPGRQELAPIGEFIGKIMAAKNAQINQEFMVIARVEALIAGWGQEEALQRAHAYIDAGADAILMHSKAKTAEEIFTFAKLWKNKAPLVVVPTAYPEVTEQELEDHAVKMVIYANHGLRASIKAINHVLHKLHDAKTLKSIQSDIVSMQEVFDLQGMTRMKKEEALYVRSENEPITVIIPAAGAPRNQESIAGLLTEFPVAMLDIYGKPLLQRNIETLNQMKITDIHVIVGYRADNVLIEGARLIKNQDYEKTHIVDSIMKAEDVMKGKTIIAYADILFESHIIEQLLKHGGDIILVVDATDIKADRRNKKLDLVVTKHKPAHEGRVIGAGKKNPIVQIGKNIPDDKSTYEFIGLACFSAQGIEIFKQTYHASKQTSNAKPFQEAPSFALAGFTDLIQEIIDQGAEVLVMEVASGWAEVHTFEGYKKVSSSLEYRLESE